MMEKLNLRSGGKDYQLWTGRELADKQAASLSPVYDIPFVSSTLPGHDDLWFIKPRGTKEGALGADGRELPLSFIETMERTEVFIKLARQYTAEANERFWAHCAIWMSIDPYDVAELGVPVDEYSTWAAATVHMCEQGFSQTQMANAIKGLFTDLDGHEVSDARADALAEVFLRK
jgi:hypothetical protein